MNEVEDPMTARVEARDECGPGHRALRRHGRAKRRERSGCGKAREMWHPAAGHQVPRQLMIDPVEAEDDHAPFRLLTAAAAGDVAANHARHECREPDAGRRAHANPATA